ncbi:MAG TPA: SUMF1/EgtB/PvdO family nonheme iron enzyme [Flavitalea sp.]|nr:SUMF1/EgtB/PvdO family nonheme iron enzyme [Flavitalea sp.]
MKYFIFISLLFPILSTSAQGTIKNKTGIEFVLIKPGSFLCGKFNPTYPKPGGKKNSYTAKDYRCAEKLAKKDGLPGFIVSISKPFYIGKYEITQEQWKKIMNTNPSYFKGDHLPADNITWNDAQAFISTLNGIDSVHHYRLPTEFEWEYAARAGTQDDISWDEIREQAQIGTPSTNKPGIKKPNAWGLYDMLGNVWEWTGDLYNKKIFADINPPSSGSQHVLKGASFAGDVKNATYMTHAAGPANGWDVGLRIVMEENAESSKTFIASTPEKENIKGWHISRSTHQGTTPSVKFKDGMITLAQQPYGQGGVLLSDKKYHDFELTVEVKIDSFCNSGIFLRSTESGKAYQVELAEPGGTGNLFGEMMKISQPAEAVNKARVWKPLDWNYFRIRMTGNIPHITLWMNGEMMWDVTQPANDFTAGATEGMIGFQTHWSATYSSATKAFDMSDSWKPGAEIRFRNIVIKEL